MKVNINNYVRYYFTDDAKVLDINKFLENINFYSHHGCNGHVLDNGQDTLFVIIPNKFINEVEKESGVSLREILKEFNLMGFKYKLHKSTLKKRYLFTDDNYYSHKDSIIFELNVDDNGGVRNRYYAFCMIRHFYYYQSYLVEYLKLTNKEDSEETKLQKLGYCSRFNFDMYTYVQKGVLYCKTFSSYSQLCSKYYGNYSHSALPLSKFIFKINKYKNINFDDYIKLIMQIEESLKHCVLLDKIVNNLEEYRYDIAKELGLENYITTCSSLFGSKQIYFYRLENNMDILKNFEQENNTNSIQLRTGSVCGINIIEHTSGRTFKRYKVN